MNTRTEDLAITDRAGQPFRHWLVISEAVPDVTETSFRFDSHFFLHIGHTFSRVFLEYDDIRWEDGAVPEEEDFVSDDDRLFSIFDDQLEAEFLSARFERGRLVVKLSGDRRIVVAEDAQYHVLSLEGGWGRDSLHPSVYVFAPDSSQQC